MREKEDIQPADSYTDSTRDITIDDGMLDIGSYGRVTCGVTDDAPSVSARP